MADDRNVDVIDLTGKKAGSVSLPGSIFDVPTNIPLMHQVVVAQLAAARQGTHATKTRGQVAGGGKKPFRQKGTGNARPIVRAPTASTSSPPCSKARSPRPRPLSPHCARSSRTARLSSSSSAATN